MKKEKRAGRVRSKLCAVLLSACFVVSGAAAMNTFAAGGVIERGDQGEAVYYVQSLLVNLGFLSESPDGAFGSNTESAVEAFQRAQGLYVDGIVGPGTMSALESAGSAQPQEPEVPAGSGLNASMVLQNGSRGQAVLELQQLLADLGYNPGGADGSFGNNTANAVRAFQQANGLFEDGIAGPATIQALMGQPTPSPSEDPSASGLLQQGSTGQAVRDLQQMLANLGYNVGDIDGAFGSLTLSAVSAFQSAQGLHADGVAGSSTMARLSSLTTPEPVVLSDADRLAREKLNEIGWDIQTAYNWCVNTTFDASVTGNTVSGAGSACLQANAGDCVARASAFCLMARALGYNAYVILGKVPYTNGEDAEHSWVEITIDGSVYVCDPDFEWEFKKNGYMFTYGTSGTYVYKDGAPLPE